MWHLHGVLAFGNFTMSTITIKLLIHNFDFFLMGSSATSGTVEREWLAKEHSGKDQVLTSSYSKDMYIQIINT
jgi:hypothetical protein